MSCSPSILKSSISVVKPIAVLLTHPSIRQIGTNAIPFLVDWACYEPAPSKEWSIGALNKSLEYLDSKLGGKIDWRFTAHDHERALLKIAPEALTNAPPP
jgi:hypothetical protein